MYFTAVRSSGRHGWVKSKEDFGMNKRQKLSYGYKTVLKCLCGLALIAILAVLVSMLRGRNGGGESDITGLAYYESAFPADAYTAYFQRDRAWADFPLGKSKDTMGGSGCLTCCIAASLKAQGIYEYTPGELNQLFSSQDVYNEDGSIIWDSLEKALPQAEVLLDRGTDSESLDRLLKEGKYPIVKVRRKSGAVHWIMLTGTEKDSFDITAMDPIDGLVHMSDYGNRIYGVRVVTTGSR